MLRIHICKAYHPGAVEQIVCSSLDSPTLTSADGATASGQPVEMASADDVEMVVMVTGFEDRHMITNALQRSHGNVETVINEYLDDPDKVGHSHSAGPPCSLVLTRLTPSQFRHTYSWDEAAFSTARDGDNMAGNNASIPGGCPPSQNVLDASHVDQNPAQPFRYTHPSSTGPSRAHSMARPRAPRRGQTTGLL